MRGRRIGAHYDSESCCKTLTHIRVNDEKYDSANEVCSIWMHSSVKTIFASNALLPDVWMQEYGVLESLEDYIFSCWCHSGGIIWIF